MEYLAEDDSLFLNTHSDTVEFNSELSKHIIPCPSARMADKLEVKLLFNNVKLSEEEAVYDPRSSNQFYRRISIFDEILKYRFLNI